jgi:hypothetical protein
MPVKSPLIVRPTLSIAVLAACALVAGCGDDQGGPPVPAGAPDPEHAREVARDPYLVTCADIARQPLHPTSQKLVIRAEFALAQDPRLREVVAKQTLNRTGRSVYYAITEICKGRRPSFEPARLAVEGVRSGRYRAAEGRPG